MMQPAPATNPTPKWARAVFVGLLVIHAGLLFDSRRRNFVVVDEASHIPSGISHWQTGSYSLYRGNPPLPRMLATLPLLLAAPNTAGIILTDSPGTRAEFPSATQFAWDNADRYMTLVGLARLSGIGWSVIGAWLVFRWSRELYGNAAGCLGMALWCLGPNILAHAPLVTPDLPATVACLAATYVFWHYLKEPSWRTACLAGLLLGIAQLTKFTCLALYAIWPMLWLMYRVGADSPACFGRKLIREGVQGFAMVVLSVVVLNWGYEFDGTGKRLGEYRFISRSFSGEQANHIGPADNRFRDSWLGAVPVPLPAQYLRGIDEQRHVFENGGRSYLAGEWRDRGWWYYYLYGLAVKVPLGVWLLVLAGMVLSIARHPSSARWRDELTLWVPAIAILALVSSQTGFNRHLRYVLPMAAFVLIATSKVAYFLQPQRWKAGLAVAGCLVWAIGSSLSIHPHSLSYFNELAGGPNHGHNHLIDSSIDWGQDLLFLREWLDQHPEARPLGLAYNHVVDPRVVGIEYELPPFGPPALPLDSAAAMEDYGPRPGYYALSINFVRGKSRAAPAGKEGATVWVPFRAYEYFQRFRPIAKAGYSIFIYRITLEEANTVRRDLGLPPLPSADAAP